MTILHFWHLRLYYFSSLIFKCNKLHQFSHINLFMKCQDKPSLWGLVLYLDHWIGFDLLLLENSQPLSLNISSPPSSLLLELFDVCWTSFYHSCFLIFQFIISIFGFSLLGLCLQQEILTFCANRLLWPSDEGYAPLLRTVLKA